MQWYLVSVIVVGCAVLALRAALLGIRALLRGDRGAVAERSPCGGCGGCSAGRTSEAVPIIQLGRKDS